MPNRIVLGSQWGDEGKAKIVDYLTDDADVIIRFQGGANAGHTVLVGDQEFVFHLIPSGIMHQDKACVVGNGVVLDPVQLLKEIADLSKRGIHVDGRLFIAENAHVVLPWHTELDRLKEIAAGKNAIGTTGRGIGPCYSDKVNRLGIRIGDLLSKEILTQKINRLAEERNREFELLWNGKAIDPAPVIEEFIEYGKQFAPFVRDVPNYLAEATSQGKTFIFEGAQGTILDVDHGTYPFVTSSNTVAGSACCGSGVGPSSIDQVVGVVKAYTTRVGNGPFPTELDDANGELLRKNGQEFGATTGRPRRCGWFDAPVVLKSARVNGLTHLAITKMDVMDDFDEIQVCTSYKLGDQILETLPSQPNELNDLEPIYETLPGWKSSTSQCKTWNELPENAQKYLEYLSKLVGVKIGMVSVGPRRDQSITIDLD